MPVDRSPPRTSGTGSSIAQETDNAAAFLPETSRVHLSANSETHQMGEPNQINSNEFRLIKLPTFWHKQPKLWFAQLESEFLVYRIRSDDVKYSSVVRHLDEQALISVSEFIENPPEKDKYINLKEALINRFTDSEEKRLRQLLAGIELNDKKPSELLREIKQLSGGAISENVLHTIWLQRLPLRIQATLAVVEEVSLAKLAVLADKILDRDNGLQVSEVTPKTDSKISDFAALERRIAALEVSHRRSRSKFRPKGKRFRTPSRNSKDRAESEEKAICFYHKKFGSKALKCTIPCSMSKSLLTDQGN